MTTKQDVRRDTVDQEKQQRGQDTNNQKCAPDNAAQERNQERGQSCGPAGNPRREDDEQRREQENQQRRQNVGNSAQHAQKKPSME